MDSEVVQANYDQLEAIARRFGQQAQRIDELRSQLQRSAQPLEQGGWQGRGSAAFFQEMNGQIVPATQRLRLALDQARAVTMQIGELLRRAEQEASAPFRGSSAASTNGAAGGGQAPAQGQATDSGGPSAALIAAGLAADFTPVVGELKGLVEIFTGRDLVTGEELGMWRFAGILGLVGLNEVKHLRHAGKLPDVARGTGAFLKGIGGGDGLGKLAGKVFNVSPKGLNMVEQHLKQFGPVPANSAMIDRLRAAISEGRKIDGADASFYLHELSEATHMSRLTKQGMSFEDAYEVAHAAALRKYQVSPFSVYHPDVIRSLPEEFNANWLKFWDNLGQ